MDFGKKFREMSDRHQEETGEGFFSGVEHKGKGEPSGYYFTFGYFTDPAVAMVEAQKRRDAVPHVMATGMDNGQEYSYRRCPAMYCIGSPHPVGTYHHDNTGATWRTRDNGDAYDVEGHDGE